MTFSRICLLPFASLSLFFAIGCTQSTSPTTSNSQERPALVPASATGAATVVSAAIGPAEPALNTPLALTLADNGKTVNLANHKSITIILTGNATTGFRWDVTKVTGPALQKVGDVQYNSYNTATPVAGTPGTFVATFKPVAPGTTTIDMGYARPFENGVPPSRVFTVTVVVDKVPQ